MSQIVVSDTFKRTYFSANVIWGCVRETVYAKKESEKEGASIENGKW